MYIVFRALINSFVCLFWTSALGLVLFPKDGRSKQKKDKEKQNWADDDLAWDLNVCFFLTLSLPGYHLKTTNNSVKFEIFMHLRKKKMF